MTTVIDSLVVELALDPTKFAQVRKQISSEVERVKKDAQRAGKEMEAAGGGAGRFFDTLTKKAAQFLGLFGIGVGAKDFVQFLRNVSNSDAQVGRLAKTFDVTAATLSKWRGAVRAVGGEVGDADAAFGALTSGIQQFQLTGESSLIPYLRSMNISLVDSHGKIKTADTLLLDLSDHLSKMDPARAAELARNMGIPPSVLNILLQGRDATEKMLETMEKIGGTTDEASRRAQIFIDRWAKAKQQMEETGREFLKWLEPEAAERAGQAWLKAQGYQVDKSGTKIQPVTPTAPIMPGEPKSSEPGVFDRLYNSIFGPRATPSSTGGAAPTSSAAPTGIMSEAQTETYIRQSALRRGIDPNIAVAVARSEGLGGKYAGDEKSSFGPFQLHYGGVAREFPRAGLGDEFTKQTGLDARDPSTVKQQIDFAMANAARSGWGQWYGWRGTPFAGISDAARTAARAGDTHITNNTSDVHIERIEVNTQATDADSIARDIKPAMERHGLASQANSGPG